VTKFFDVFRQEVAFRYAVERVNANRNILPKSLLSAQIEKIPPQDSFHASKRGKRFRDFWSKDVLNFVDVRFTLLADESLEQTALKR
jgi:hypothetical protein